MLANFFAKPPVKLGFLKRGIRINMDRLQRIEPGLCQNLLSSCNSYIDGLVQQDEQFIKNTTSPYLFSKIQPEIAKVNASGEGADGFEKQLTKRFDIRMDPESGQLSGFKDSSFEIYPFVVFGATLPERIADHPFRNLRMITRNRFLNMKNNSLSSHVRSLMNDQTYGFRCLLKNDKKQQDYLTITLEGNIETKEYYIVDLADQLMVGLTQ